MNAKEITIENIENYGSNIGNSIKGKGLEIYDFPRYVEMLYRNTQDERKKILEKINPDEVFIKECRYLSEDGKEVISKYYDNDFKSSLSRHDVKKIFESDFAGFQYISFYRIPKKLGYISVSKYNATLDSQKELIADLLALEGKEIYTDEREYYAEDNSAIFFKNEREGNYYVDDYSLEYGGHYAMDETAAEYIDTRVYGANWNVVEDFWNFREKERFSEVDPKKTVSIYHRKGKDFYVTHSLEEFDMTLVYKEEEFNYEVDDYEETELEYLVYTPNEEAIDKCVSMIKKELKEIKIKSYLYDELRISDGHGNDFSNNDNVFNLNIVNNCFDNEFEAAYAIENFIEWSNSQDEEKAIVAKAYDKWLEANISDDVLLKKYTHLKLLKTIVEQDGKEIVYSRIGDFTDDMSYAIKFKGEEYHFTLGELYSSNPKEFYKNISKSLTLRLVERYETTILMQKAKYVFVGLEDSYKSGNCKTGTNSWTSKFGIDTSKIGGIRGDEILRIDFSNFTKRAVLQAITNHSNVA